MILLRKWQRIREKIENFEGMKIEIVNIQVKKLKNVELWRFLEDNALKMSFLILRNIDKSKKIRKILKKFKNKVILRKVRKKVREVELVC